MPRDRERPGLRGRRERNPRKREMTRRPDTESGASPASPRPASPGHARPRLASPSLAAPSRAAPSPAAPILPDPAPPSTPSPAPPERDPRPAVYAYARISTDETRQNIETQLHELRDWTAKAGYRLERTYTDSASAGDMRGRKEWRKLLDDLQTASPRFRPAAVVCVRLDRFTRSVSDCAATLSLLDSLNVRLITTDGLLGGLLESSPAIAGLLRYLLVAFGAFEQALITERVRAGMRRAAAEGKPIGRKPRSIDWEAHAALPSGLSVRARANALGVPHAVLSRQEKARGLTMPPAPPPTRGPGGKFRTPALPGPANPPL